jgi:hypothetical protein
MLIPMTECDSGWALNSSLGVARKTSLRRDCKFWHFLAACEPSFRAGHGVAEIFHINIAD